MKKKIGDLTLKELKEMYIKQRNSNPSKALEEIKTLRGFNQVELNNDENINKSLDIIERVLIKAQEQEKVLEIIKEKGVNVGEFEKELDWDKFDYKFYLCYYKEYSLEELTQEEFELLKRHFVQ